MKSNFKKLMILGVSTLLSLIACGGSGESGSEGSSSGSKVGKYTYNTYLETKPKTWNVHDWESSDESYIPAFTEMGFYDVALNESKDGYDIVCEMAAEMPKDVSLDISDEDFDKYGYLGNPVEGTVWEIKLNQNACWEDGTPIKADDYVQSMERQLNSKFVNFRADSYYASTLVIANAERYYKQGRSTIEPLYNHIKEDGSYDSTDVCSDGYYFINIARYTPYVASVFSGTDETTTFYSVLNNRSDSAGDIIELAAQRITDAVRYYCWQYMTHEGDYKSDWDEIEGYGKLSSIKEEMLNFNIDIDEFSNNDVYVRKFVNDSSEENSELYSTDALKADLKTVVSGLGRGGITGKSFAWQLPLFANIYNDFEETFDNVGIKAIDEYTIKLFLKQAVTELDLKFSLSSNWLVNLELYDKLTFIDEGGYKQTRYATPAGGVNGYRSYGPYKLVSYEEGKAFRMEKNDKWYGYTDGKHIGQYQMTGVYTRIITDHNAAIQDFLRGELDDIALNRSDMKSYGNSSRLTSTYESYTQKISMNSNRAKLLSRQSGNENKTVLANYNFRKGLSLAMDRNMFASQTTAGSKAFTGLLNDLYLTDVETGEMYRSTEQGKSVYQAVYGELGGDPFADGYTPSALDESSNGYNLQQATYFVAEGLKEELQDTKDGHLKKGDIIKLEFRVYDNESETTIDMLNFITASFSKVMEKAVEVLKDQQVLGAEDNIQITIDSQKDEDYYNSAKAGNYDLIFSTWGGAAINPIGLMQVYCDSTFESCCEYGFKGKQNDTYLDIDVNGDGEISSSEHKTFNNWWTYVNGITENDEKGSEAYNKKHKEVLDILAALEAGILNRFEAIPLVARATSSLNSFKIENGSPTYINLVGYGGIRHMTFNYDDAEWEQFLSEFRSQLSDLYKE